MDEVAYEKLVGEIVGKYLQAKGAIKNPALLPKLEEWISYFEKQKDPQQRISFTSYSIH
jgi:hypothetical protein